MPQIPLSFSPEVIVEDRAVVEIRGQLGGRSLTWVFPIVGVGEAPGGLRVFSIACPAKSSTREDFEVCSIHIKEVKRVLVFSEIVLCTYVAWVLQVWLLDRQAGV